MEKYRLSWLEFKIKDFTEQNDDFFIEGIASPFGIPDDEPNKWGQFDIMHKGAFTKTLKENKGRIKIYLNHDLEEPIGIPVELSETNEGLYVKASISKSEEDVRQKIREGIYGEFSIGFVPIKSEIRYGAMPNGADVRDLYEVRLWEISVLTLGKNQRARFAEVKGMEDTDVLEQKFDELIDEETDETKKYKLMMLKDLALEPKGCSLKPKKEIKSIFSQMKFSN